MKIDFVIHSSDSHPFYLDFWPLVSRVWKEVFGLNPILLYVDENHDIPIDETYGSVIKFKPVPDVPKYLQCLWIRYWWPSQVPDKVCILSDIDMFPLSRRYFIDQIADIPDTKYVHLNPMHQYLPSCYHVAKGRLFKEVLNLHDSWEESARYIHSLDNGTAHSTIVSSDMKHWGADEHYATEKVRAYPDQSLFVFLVRYHRRIDRTRWEYNPEHIRNDVYADSHSIRPYSDSKNKLLIEKLLNEIRQYC